MDEQERRRRLVNRIPAQFRDHVREELDKEAAENKRLDDERAGIEAGKAAAARINAARAQAATSDSDAIARETARDLAPHAHGDARPRALNKREQAWRARGQKQYKSALRHVRAYKAKLQRLGQWDADPRPVSPKVHRCAQLMRSDPTQRNARLLLAELPPAVARRIKQAALCPRYYDPRHRRGTPEHPVSERELYSRVRYVKPGERDWTHPIAAKTLIVGVCLWWSGRRTARRGFTRLTRGVPRGLLCALLEDRGVRPHVSSLSSAPRGVPGPLPALEQAGVFYRNQPPASKCPPSDVGPKGYAFNVYWWFASSPKDLGANASDARHDELLALCAPGILAELGLDDARAPPDD